MHASLEAPLYVHLCRPCVEYRFCERVCVVSYSKTVFRKFLPQIGEDAIHIGAVMINTYGNLRTITFDDMDAALQHIKLIAFNICLQKPDMLILKKLVDFMNDKCIT